MIILPKNNLAKQEILQKIANKFERIKNNIKHLMNLIETKEFMDSFKEVFIEKQFNIDLNEIKKLKRLI